LAKRRGDVLRRRTDYQECGYKSNRDVQIDPHRIFPIGDDVSLAGEARQKGRRGAFGIAQRNLKLVGGRGGDGRQEATRYPGDQSHLDAVEERVKEIVNNALEVRS